MHQNKTKLVTLFADISGSTRLYEALGDTLAHQKLSGCIDQLSAIIKSHNGVLIKTIGDEIMATFLRPDNALEAACAIQEELTGSTQNPISDVAIRVGFHYGPVIVERNDVFGDTVNVAARLVDLAKEGQIITTRETVSHMSPHLQEMTRHLYHIQVKGRQEGVNISEVVWENLNVTYIGTAPKIPIAMEEQILQLSYDGNKKIVSRDSDAVTLGRSPENDLIINEPRISRKHARIEYLAGKFILSDHSSNGTYVHVKGSKPVFLRREKLILLGSGVIHFFPGKDPNNTHIIYYNCISRPVNR